MIPERGDFIWLNFDPQVGHEEAKRRPALVLSPAEYHSLTGLIVVCPVTSVSKGYPFEVAVPPDAPVSGFVLADHVKSLDFAARRGERIGPAPASLVDEVLAKVAALLDLKVY